MAHGYDGYESEAGTIESATDITKTPKAMYDYWAQSLSIAADTDKDFSESAQLSYDIYEGEKNKTFNILFSNVQTTIPAIYNQRPTPDIRTRFNDRDELARQGASLLERCTSYGMDEYDFDDVIKTIIRDLVVTSRGVGRVRYVPLMRTVGVEQMNPQTQQMETVQEDQIVWQSAPCEYVPWTHFRHEPCKIWGDCNWIAFKHFMTRDELVDLAGEEIGNLIRLEYSDDQEKYGNQTGADSGNTKSAFKKALVWEIWDKTERRVIYITAGYEFSPIAIEDDPLNLLDFFPIPKPMLLFNKNKDLSPIPIYKMYQEQAEELDLVSKRIKSLTAVCKARGIYASEIAEFEQLSTLEDGEYTPSEGAMATLATGKISLDDVVWTFPIADIIMVIRELIIQREQIKETIYEIIGIADIMRGQSNAGETLGAQEIKTEWGTLRIQNTQDDVQRFVRDIIRLQCEIFSSQYTQQTFTYIMGQDVQPEVIDGLRNDVQRVYAIDIETDSTVKGDLMRSKKEKTEFLQASAQYLAVVGPMVDQGILPKELAIGIYNSFASDFKLGKNIEDMMTNYMDLAKKQAETGADREKEEAKQRAQEAQAADLQNKTADTENKQADTMKKTAEAGKADAQTAQIVVDTLEPKVESVPNASN